MTIISYNCQATSRLVDDYLSPTHCHDLGSGCVISALAGEIARSSSHIRALTSEETEHELRNIGNSVSGMDEETARSRAILTFSTLVGALSLSRTNRYVARSFGSPADKGEKGRREKQAKASYADHSE